MKKLLSLIVLFSFVLTSSAFAMSEPEETVDKARVTAEGLFSDPNYPYLLDLATRAKAILIVPNMIKVGFFIGGRGGNAVLLSKDSEGKWSNPAFYTLGGLSYGLQIGAQSSQLIITIMTEKGLQAIMNNKVTLGADANVALGEIGAGAQASTGMDTKADMYAFAKSSGVFAGIALDGTVISPRQSYNEEFYGKGTTPAAILLDRTAMNPASQPLIDAMPN
ncbi:MAG: lipid-binding SYLF domain-containing protein [Bdellovibrionales bacterium]